MRRAISLIATAGLLSLSCLDKGSTSEPALPITVHPAPKPAPSPTPNTTHCPDPMTFPEGFVCIEPGSFLMGSPESEKGRSDDEILHRVRLTRAYFMKTTEVTQRQWQASMGNNPSHFNTCGPSCPVEQVSWYDAIAYANALSKKEGLERCYQDGNKDYDVDSASAERTPSWPKGLSCLGYRLPTEAEWEYAARAATATAFHTGGITEPEGQEPNMDKAGWYDKNSDEKTHPVGEKMANAWGLYDMHGNVFEWVWDAYEVYDSEEQQDPVSLLSNTHPVGRGGSWDYEARTCRSAYRSDFRPDSRFLVLGFRLARSIP